MIENDEQEISDFGDAQVVITIARWRSHEVERKKRIRATARWVERKVQLMISWVSSEEHGIFWFRSLEEYTEYFENIRLTLAPEPLRTIFRSRALDTLLYQNTSLWLPLPSRNQD